jgi:hypothetical protein
MADTTNREPPGSDTDPSDRSDEDQGARLSSDKLGNMHQAMVDLNLTDEEVNLYMHGLRNLHSGGGYEHADGSLSPIMARLQPVSAADPDGQQYLIPTAHGSSLLNDRELADAIEENQRGGLDAYPKYAGPKEAMQRYADIHAYMNKDVVDKRVADWQAARGASTVTGDSPDTSGPAPVPVGGGLMSMAGTKTEDQETG